MVHLSLGHNDLSEIPECVGKMTKLKYLYLQNNVEITMIPAFVAGITALQEIRLENNNIESLPSFLGGLPNISYIGMR